MTIRSGPGVTCIFLLGLLSSFGATGTVAQETRGAARIDRIAVETGSGSFIVKGGGAYEEKRITVFYYKPESFDRESPVMMVIPGAGRNGDDYRDAWVEVSETYGVLILSPSYPENFYPEYWSYNLVGMTREVTLDLRFVIDTKPEEWIFDDFDRIFERVKDELGLEAEEYDLFGHSAGGQILHRLALFHPNGRAGRILTGNSGWYTVPTFEREFPYGLKGSGMAENRLEAAFGADLVVFLGEEDDEDETRGSVRRTPEADRQGTHRLERGRYFFREAREAAEALGVDFEWKMEIVPGVGHDYERMSEAAAEYLYGGEVST